MNTQYLTTSLIVPCGYWNHVTFVVCHLCCGFSPCCSSQPFTEAIDSNHVLSCAPSPVEIRAQLVEQQKCLDQQTDMRVQLLQDLQDFFRKKSEIEMEYSRNLEKLAERFMAKTRSTKDHQQYK